MAAEQSAHSEAHETEQKAHTSHDQTVLLGRTIPFPIYTVVFGILAAATVIEVIISTLPKGALGTAILIALSAMKAILVVLFYMHLREDSRIFAIALGIPLFIAAVAMLFLTTVPPGSY